MVNGQFKCIGSTQHLKYKFGKGFVLTVKLKRISSTYEGTEDMSELKNQVIDFIDQEFTGAELKYEI